MVIRYFDAALNDYDKAIELNPKLSFAYRAPGYLKELNGDKKKLVWTKRKQISMEIRMLNKE